MSAETEANENTYVPLPTPKPHPSRPLGVVDRDGFMWPWDGREPDEHLLAAGSRYVYARAEFEKLLAESQSKQYVTMLPSIDDPVPPPGEAVDAAEAQKAMGFKPEPSKARRQKDAGSPLTGL